MSFIEQFRQNTHLINEATFADSSLAAFDFQYNTNSVYRSYCQYLKKTPQSIRNIGEIPFLPIAFFKSHTIKSGSWKEEKIFKSSGTTATGRSQHYIQDLEYYHQLAKRSFERHVGPITDYRIIALLPSYREQGDSSLISMVDYFLKYAKKGSGYFLSQDISEALQSDERKLLIGVSYALLDLAEKDINTRNCLVMETGGMKGRRKELTREELHSKLRKGLKVDQVWSEYGMTELLSQAYGKDGNFSFPSWAKCLIRDINDPFTFLEKNKTGGINIIDLANIDSCCFIETKDLGKASKNGFHVLGRFDNSDIRGCNLLI